MQENKINVPCPHCGQVLQIREQYRGSSGTCKHCGNSFVVPMANSETSAPIVSPDPPEASPTPAKKPTALSALFILFVWTLYAATIILGTAGASGITANWFSFIPFFTTIIVLIFDLLLRKKSGAVVALWAILALLLHPFVVPFYLFRREDTRLPVSAPASILLGVLAGALAAILTIDPITGAQGGSIVERIQAGAETGEGQGKAGTPPQKSAPAVAGVSAKTGVDIAKLSDFRVHDFYLGMARQESVDLLRKSLPGVQIGEDLPTGDMLMFALSQTSQSALIFTDGILIGYAFESDVVDKLFKAAALDAAAFAKLFVEKYGLEGMLVEQDANGNEELICRDSRGFMVTITAKKALSVVLLPDAGTPEFK